MADDGDGDGDVVVASKKQFPWRAYHEDLLITNVVYHKAHMCKHGEGAKTWDMIAFILTNHASFKQDLADVAGNILTAALVQAKFDRMKKACKAKYTGPAVNLSGEEGEISATQKNLIKMLKEIEAQETVKALQSKAEKEKQAGYDKMDLSCNVEVGIFSAMLLFHPYNPSLHTTGWRQKRNTACFDKAYRFNSLESP